MKKTIFITIALILLFSAPVLAVDLSAEYFKALSQNENFGQSDGVKIRGAIEESDIYLWMSGEIARFSLVGQTMPNVQLIGTGIGLKKEVSNFEFFIEVGWYFVSSDFDEVELTRKAGDYGDRADIYLNNKYADTLGVSKFDYYRIDLKSNFGGSIGVNYNHEITKSFSCHIGAAYRMLSIPMYIDAWNVAKDDSWLQEHRATLTWAAFEDQDLSGPILSIGFMIKF